MKIARLPAEQAKLRKFVNYLMLILGIDPGIERCGWGLVEETGGKVKAIFYDCFFTSKEVSTSERLKNLSDQLNDLLNKYHPDIVAMEDLFFGTNAKTAIVVGQARGVVMLSVENFGIPLVSYPPLEIKMSITGYGRADKNQIGQMVKNIFKLREVPKPDDTTDALAVALTHCFVSKLKSKIARRM